MSVTYKAILAGLLGWCLSGPAVAAPVVMEDLNRDGAINIVDILHLVTVVLGLESPTTLTCDIDYSVSLHEGWNWVGFPQVFQGQSLNAFWESATTDYNTNLCTEFLSHTDMSYYYPGYGWAGTIQEVDPFKGYKVKCDGPLELSFQGAEVTGNVEIAVPAGWSWLAYPFEVPGFLDPEWEGTDGVTMVSSLSGFSQYYPSYGWYGSLSEFAPNVSYQVQGDFGGGTVLWTHPDCGPDTCCETILWPLNTPTDNIIDPYLVHRAWIVIEEVFDGTNMPITLPEDGMVWIYDASDAPVGGGLWQPALDLGVPLPVHFDDASIQLDSLTFVFSAPGSSLDGTQLTVNPSSTNSSAGLLEDNSTVWVEAWSI